MFVVIVVVTSARRLCFHRR